MSRPKSTDHPGDARRDSDRQDDWFSGLAVLRDSLRRHFDLVVVVWVLTIAVTWSVVVLAKADLSREPWSVQTPNNSGWVSSAGETGP